MTGGARPAQQLRDGAGLSSALPAGEAKATKVLNWGLPVPAARECMGPQPFTRGASCSASNPFEVKQFLQLAACRLFLDLALGLVGPTDP